MDISHLVEAANLRLKSARVQVSIETRGKAQNLYLRSSLLPPKPGQQRPKDGRIRIALLMPGTPETVRFAEEQAKLLDAELKLNRFDWHNWKEPEPDKLGTRKISDWVEIYTEKYKPTVSDGSWRNYRKALNRLPQDETLSLEILVAALDSYPANGSSQKIAGLVYRQLAALAEMQDTDILKVHEGNYSKKPINPRDLPSDVTIYHCFTELSQKSQEWGWIFGILATYGLRNHEVFLIDLEDFPSLRVSNTNKTRTERIVRPLYPEWAEDWNLGELRYPPRLRPSDGDNQALGKKITAKFYKTVPFSAYNLRHCYARRCFECDVPIKLAARMLGHSVQVHEQCYRAWIDEAAYADMYDRVMQKEGRLRSPL